MNTVQYAEEDWFPLSAISKYVYCQRRFALAYIEDQWPDNVHTIVGKQMHERVHDPEVVDVRPGKIVKRAVRVFSAELGVSGECDVVEFLQSVDGIALAGHAGLWTPFPVEYKKGRPVFGSPENDYDALQLCCQAMCLESMLACRISVGFLYYVTIRRRARVEFTDTMRVRVRECLQEMHRLYDRKYTPKVKKKKSCNGCSLYDTCMPTLFVKKSVDSYIESNIGNVL